METYPPARAEIDRIISLALAEDVGSGDLTTLSTIPEAANGRADFLVKACGVLAGLPVAAAVFTQVDPRVTLSSTNTEGDELRPGDRFASVQGPARSLLTGERVALNFLQHLSGIATRTRAFVRLVEDTGARIVDTRKTVPGMRALAKYAVRVGGGANHRFALYDGILIKDNHIQAAGSIITAVEGARRLAPHLLRIEVETTTLGQVEEALAAGADIVLLDNMDLETMREAVRICAGRALTEASGGVTETTVRAIAETGVNLISVGALTHSVAALDISLDWS